MKKAVWSYIEGIKPESPWVTTIWDNDRSGTFIYLSINFVNC